MKPTSIIFLCLSVLLVVGGIVTCYIASGMARDAGIELFETSSDIEGNNIINNELDADGLNKVSLILKNADVAIHGGAESSYIELVNYGTNTYSYAVSNGILSVDESVGFLSLLNFTDTSVSFGGLRQYLKWRGKSGEPRSVNIYLTDEYQLKQLEIKVEDGDVTIDGSKCKTDYSIEIGKGSLVFTNNNSNSTLTIAVGEGNVSVGNSSIINLGVTIKRGDFDYSVSNYAYQSYSIVTDDGAVYLAGKEYGTSLFASTPMAFTTVTAEIKSGDVYINGASAASGVDTASAASESESAAESTQPGS